MLIEGFPTFEMDELDNKKKDKRTRTRKRTRNKTRKNKKY